MVYLGTGRHQEEIEELAGNQNRETVDRQNRLEPFCPSTCVKQKQCWKKK
jgi:hypothetical protein